MTVRISYFVHGTTPDNQQHLASGHNDIELAKIGEQQSKELGVHRKDTFDIIISSDLKRAVDSATFAFKERAQIIQDARIRECNFGDLTQKEKTWDLAAFINTPYPNGESYKDVEKRMKDFLKYLKENFAGKHVALMAHQAPQLALDVICRGLTWKEAIANDWRNTKNWQPGWEYVID